MSIIATFDKSLRCEGVGMLSDIMKKYDNLLLRSRDYHIIDAIK